MKENEGIAWLYSEARLLLSILTEEAEAEEELPPELRVLSFHGCDLGVLFLVDEYREVMAGTTGNLQKIPSGLSISVTSAEELDGLGVELL